MVSLLMSPFLCLSQPVVIKDPVKLLALGDSYTVGQGVAPGQAWPRQLVSELRRLGIEAADPTIIAVTGWRTDQLIGALNSFDPPHEYNLVSLLIGVNNFYQLQSIETYAEEFDQLLDTAIGLAGDTSSVFVLSIPDYGYTPFGQSNQPSISEGIDAFNEVNETLTKSKGIAYFNITDISRRGLDQPNLVADDGLHPSGVMYELWVERILNDAVIKKDTSSSNPVTSIEEPINSVIYPNPCREVLHIRGDNNVKVAEVISTSGQLIFSCEASSDLTLDTSDWPAGLYLLRLHTNAGMLHKRFLKQAR